MRFIALRIQLLLMTPLPSVETACSVLQQEESQKEILSTYVHPLVDSVALYSKNASNETCPKCGNKGHPKERCWEIIGYPNWHPKTAQFPQKRTQQRPQTNCQYSQNNSYNNAQNSLNRPQSEGYRNFGKNSRQSGGYRGKGKEPMAANVTSNTSEGLLTFTTEQFEQLLKHLASTSSGASYVQEFNTYLQE